MKVQLTDDIKRRVFELTNMFLTDNNEFIQGRNFKDYKNEYCDLYRLISGKRCIVCCESKVRNTLIKMKELAQ